MIQLVLIFLLSMTATAKADAIPLHSLFLSQEDMNKANRLAAQTRPAGTGDIRLGALMYYAPDDWSLWLQGEKWTPQTRRDDLRILEVTSSDVQIAWRDDDNQEHSIRLKPNQSYQIATGLIIDQQ